MEIWTLLFLAMWTILPYWALFWKEVSIPIRLFFVCISQVTCLGLLVIPDVFAENSEYAKFFLSATLPYEMMLGILLPINVLLIITFWLYKKLKH